MPDEFQYDVFLSHSAKDKAVVRPLAERLRKDAVKVWFDEWVLKAGDGIPAKSEEGLDQSRVLVLCMSAISGLFMTANSVCFHGEAHPQTGRGQAVRTQIILN